jgi:hypothetical protein
MFPLQIILCFVSIQLLRIEEELGNVRYAGEAFRSP